MNIGKEGETIIVEPVPETAPIKVPEPMREPEPVPAGSIRGRKA